MTVPASGGSWFSTRYLELLEAAPLLSKGDFSRLKEFRHKLLPMFLAVRLAYC